MPDIKKILIVEDDISLSNGIALALKDGDISFVQAESLRTARQSIASVHFDLIILDINLPDGNGLRWASMISNIMPSLFLGTALNFLTCITCVKSHVLNHNLSLWAFTIAGLLRNIPINVPTRLRRFIPPPLKWGTSRLIKLNVEYDDILK